MALDGKIDKTVKAPDDASLSSLNFNSVSDQPGAKPVQIADDGVFNRTRGQGQPVQGGRAHPFNDPGSVYKTTTGNDAGPQAPVQPFKDHAAEQTPKLQALGDKMQAEVTAAASGRIQGNAIEVGFADNAKRAQDLTKNWDLIGEQGGLIGAAGSATRVAGVAAFGFGMGVVAHPILKRQLSAEQASHVKVVDKHEEEVKALRDKTKADLDAIRTDPLKAAEATKLNEKHEFLKGYLKTDPKNKLEALSEFNKKNPAALLPADKAELKGMAETELKLSSVNKGLTNLGPEYTGFKGFYEHGKSGMWNGLKFVAGSLGLNYALKEGMHLLPGDHHETDRIFTQSTQESAAQALIGAAPIRNLGTKIAIGGVAWLAGREEKMTWGESIVSTVGVMGATVAAGLAVPSLRSSMPKALLAEAGAFVVGRGVHMIPGLGSEIPELTNASTDSWNAMKTDSKKMTGSSFNDAVDSFDKLGSKWRGVLAAYDRDIMGGISDQSLPIAHGDQPLNNFQNIVINGRTGMALSESLGDTVLKSGLTEDTRSDLLNTYHQQTSDEKPAPDQMLIAPNQGDLDLTSRAARSYMSALALADVTMANMKSGQTDANDTSGKNVTDSDIQAVADEKAKIVKEMSDKIFRSTPGAEAHDIKDIVEGTDGFIVSANKFKLTDYAKHDSPAYSHTVTALEDKAYAARDSWLPSQLNGPNADISKQYVAKTFRDAAVMRLGYMNYLLTTQDGHSSAPSAQDVQEMKIYMEGTQIGNQLDGPNAKRNVKSTVEAAYALEPNNPDMKAIVDEYNSIANRVLQFNQHYKDTHGGQDPYQNPIANPFGIQKPANAN
ncbi:MAG: hypothetical protein P4L53_08155 [Candidatus Obscuribacterales bacterium]|nr:hypothetical protein [Candidatus Obscuribacterales bacterium]